MKCVTERVGVDKYQCFFDGQLRAWVDIEILDGVPVVVGVQVEQPRPRPPVLVPHGKRRRRSGLGWSVVGELLEM